MKTILLVQAIASSFSGAREIKCIEHPFILPQRSVLEPSGYRLNVGNWNRKSHLSNKVQQAKKKARLCKKASKKRNRL